MRGLLITTYFEGNVLDGGEVINKRNYEVLKKTCNKLDVIYVNNKKNLTGINRKVKTLFEILFFYSFYGISFKIKNEIKNLLKENNYDFCWISSSVGGSLTKFIKKISPKLKVIVFFHNVEYDYFYQLTKSTSAYKYILALIARKNEEIAIKYADKIVVLNKRDSKRIQELYRRNVDLIFPTTFDDLCKEKEQCSKKSDNKKKILLFVGSNFFANLHGIKWFIQNVLPFLNNVILYIVGKNTEEWKSEFLEIDNVRIIGSVLSLDKYYKMADAVISPIFLGSGMKTKTAEALMYGKYIFATKEAFEGYDVDFSQIGGICNTKEEFINIINNKLPNIDRTYNYYSRKIFLEKYSTECWIFKIYKFLEE